MWTKIKQAVVTLLTDDSSQFPRTQVFHNGKATDVTRLSPYGLCSNPPVGSHAILLSSQGQEAVKFAIFDDMPNRFKNLKSGELVLFNYITKSYFFLKANGDIEIDGKNDLTANIVGDANITVGGDMSATVTGTADITSTGDMTLTAPNIKLSGNIILDGNVSSDASGPVIMPNGATISGKQFLTHAHGNVTNGPNNTSGVV